MKRHRTISEEASFALFSKFLPIAFFVATCILALPLLFLWTKYKIDAFGAIAVVIFIIGAAASLFTSREIIIRMDEDDSILFSDALAHTLYRYLTFLCFLPVLGPLLQRFLTRRQAKNPFTSDEN